LFIGRFQPLHKGHVYALREVFAQERRVLIVIGSAQACFTPEDPFTAGERIEMLQAVLKAEGIPCSRYMIIPVPDIHNYFLWVDHVTRYVPPFGIVYTGSEVVQRLFSERDYPVKVIKLYRRDTLSGTEVRRRILEGDEWKELVPQEVETIIERVGGVQRIRRIGV